MSSGRCKSDGPSEALVAQAERLRQEMTYQDHVIAALRREFLDQSVARRLREAIELDKALAADRAAVRRKQAASRRQDTEERWVAAATAQLPRLIAKGCTRPEALKRLARLHSKSLHTVRREMKGIATR